MIQVGDLVVCIHEVNWHLVPEKIPVPGPALGEYARVIGKKIYPDVVGLILDTYEDERGYAEFRFRKVQHDKAVPCEKEFITLLKRLKVTA